MKNSKDGTAGCGYVLDARRDRKVAGNLWRWHSV